MGKGRGQAPAGSPAYLESGFLSFLIHLNLRGPGREPLSVCGGRVPFPRVKGWGTEKTVGIEGRLACCSRLCCVSAAVSYTLLYNCLDFPAGVVPVTTVTAEDEAQMEHYRGYFGDIWDKVLQKVRPQGLAWPPGSPFPWTPTRTPMLAAVKEAT